MYLLSEAAVGSCSLKEGVLENFTKFTEKHLCCSLLKSCKVETSNFIVKHFCKDGFLLILQNF